MKKIVSALLLTMLVAPVLAAPKFVAKDCRVTWNAVTQNSDGTPVTGLSGYRLYVSPTSGTYNAPAAAEVGLVTELNCADINPPLIPETSQFAVLRSFNAIGNESVNSNEVNFQIIDSTPAAPSGVNVDVSISISISVP